jgi:hypothetical protein
MLIVNAQKPSVGFIQIYQIVLGVNTFFPFVSHSFYLIMDRKLTDLYCTVKCSYQQNSNVPLCCSIGFQ